jgi:6-phosphogluconolactonase
VPCDFIGFSRALNHVDNQHDLLMANLFAQTESLAFGKDAPPGEPWRAFDGNRPSNTLLAQELTPETLGKLIALYEHRTFVQGVIWGIDSFDQWGVELGKVAATRIIGELASTASASGAPHDSSTRALLGRYRADREGPARIAPSRDELAFRAATAFVEASQRAIHARGRFLVALTGGSSPKGAFEALATPEFAVQLDWSRIHFFWADERCVPPEDPRSNYRLAHETFLKRVPLPESNIHRMRGEIEPALAAREYEKILPDRLDFIWLGLGVNGHVASLFPRHPALREKTHRVLAVTVEAEVKERLTLTFPAINAAREIQMLASGAAKAEILERVLLGPRDPESYPCQLVIPKGGLIWLVDRYAAARLEGPRGP